MRPQFDYPPTVELLQILAQGNNLKQHLPKAVRLWVILRSLYGQDNDVVRKSLSDSFSYEDWYKEFFTETKKLSFDDKVYHNGRDQKPPFHDPDCPCAKSLAYWLFDSELTLPKPEWVQSFLQVYPMKPEDLEVFLATGKNPEIENNKPKNQFPNPSSNNSQRKKYAEPFPNGRLFAITRRNLQENDFATLVELGWLEPQKNQAGEILTHHYCKVQIFPSISSCKNSVLPSHFIPQVDFTEISDTYFQPINGTQRFFMHVEYVVSKDGIDRVGKWKDELKIIWEKMPVNPIQILYDSASLSREASRIVYPVCIYYFQRATYLCAFGQTLKNKRTINWHNYRLDRVQELRELDWLNPSIPAELRQLHDTNQLNEPEYILQKISAAWGLDFYRESRKMLIRFNQDFSQNYIRNSFRHETFRFLNDKQEFLQFIREYKPNEQEKELLKEIFQDLPEDINNFDYPYAYYTADYRIDESNIIDNTVMMRLRAWGPMVEVLLPGELRSRMAKDIQETWKLYHKSSQHK
ncbi:MAG: TIGR03985 family CRISPR-associated protein [Nostoc sp.]|uniref:TIGR03985 family CRISPR-associated protein n=1 Tax=Nostoc sp. TaxID=1180 RepID=UPI002FF1F120